MNKHGFRHIQTSNFTPFRSIVPDTVCNPPFFRTSSGNSSGIRSLEPPPKHLSWLQHPEMACHLIAFSNKGTGKSGKGPSLDCRVDGATAGFLIRPKSSL